MRVISLILFAPRLFPRSRRALSTTPKSDVDGPTAGPLAKYDTLVQAGTLLNDDHQRGIVAKLQKLHDRLEKYDPPEIQEEIPKAAPGGFVSCPFLCLA